MKGKILMLPLVKIDQLAKWRGGEVAKLVGQPFFCVSALMMKNVRIRIFRMKGWKDCAAFFLILSSYNPFNPNSDN